jgi:hypothetical protein
MPTTASRIAELALWIADHADHTAIEIDRLDTFVSARGRILIDVHAPASTTDTAMSNLINSLAPSAAAVWQYHPANGETGEFHTVEVECHGNIRVCLFRS